MMKLVRSWLSLTRFWVYARKDGILCGNFCAMRNTFVYKDLAHIATH